MKIEHPEHEELVARIERLESQVRRAKRFSRALLFLVLGAVGLGAASQQENFKRIVYRDRGGAIRFDLDVHPQDIGHAWFIVADENGKQRVRIGHNAQGAYIILCDAAGNVVREIK